MKTLSILCLLLMSCAVTQKKEKTVGKNSKDMTIKKIEFQKPENWADDYYQKTFFLVENPTILESFKELNEICKSNDIDFSSDYQALRPSPVKYKKETITVMSKSGFSKKVFISKGACRELTLFKAPNKKTGKNIRISIKSMNLIYIYNQGTYLRELIFNTQFQDVKFLIE
jgi:hypothetical protein